MLIFPLPWQCGFRQSLAIPPLSVRELELRQAKDKEIFAAARQANAIVMTKDADFARWWSG